LFERGSLIAPAHGELVFLLQREELLEEWERVVHGCYPFAILMRTVLDGNARDGKSPKTHRTKNRDMDKTIAIIG
jgi:hypothetical protein